MPVRLLTLPVLIGAAALGLVACTSAPQGHPTVYDLGLATAPIQGPDNAAHPALPPLVLTDVEAPPVLDGTALLYRLAYHDAQQLRPYAQARWSMPPAYLLRQRLRQQLATHRFVASPADAGAARLPLLRIELEEFSQVFEAPGQCHALLRIRATLSQAPLNALAQGPGSSPGLLAAPLAPVPALLFQTSSAQQLAFTPPDAPGGARARAEASDAVAAQLDAWLAQVSPAAP